MGQPLIHTVSDPTWGIGLNTQQAERTREKGSLGVFTKGENKLGVLLEQLRSSMMPNSTNNGRSMDWAAVVGKSGPKTTKQPPKSVKPPVGKKWGKPPQDQERSLRVDSHKYWQGQRSRQGRTQDDRRNERHYDDRCNERHYNDRRNERHHDDRRNERHNERHYDDRRNYHDDGQNAQEYRDYDHQHDQGSYYNRADLTDSVRCYYCYETNHVAKACKHASPVECHRCHCLGHKAKHHDEYLY